MRSALDSSVTICKEAGHACSANVATSTAQVTKVQPQLVAGDGHYLEWNGHTLNVQYLQPGILLLQASDGLTHSPSEGLLAHKIPLVVVELWAKNHLCKQFTALAQLWSFPIDRLGTATS